MSSVVTNLCEGIVKSCVKERLNNVTYVLEIIYSIKAVIIKGIIIARIDFKKLAFSIKIIEITEKSKLNIVPYGLGIIYFDIRLNIETDMILKKSYRNPIEILMLAHSIGLGLYSSSLPVQMIDKKDIWESIGYKVKNKDFEVGEETIINRPYENSPNPVQKFYTGKQEPITTKSFDIKKEELEWVAKCIENDIIKEKVAPEEIVVITLNTETMKRDFVYLQDLLYYQGIFASIPGIDANRDVFKKKDM